MRQTNLATYQKWSDSYTNKVTTIKLTYRGVKYNKTCDSKQSGTGLVV